ncbi:ABC transporter permease [Catellatospora sp. KI3]|uniref:ABC transporter permease n=1 Tax=Catellatospora sp. KI3 TaxID=3041620 RepID=UPI0024825CDD|nr:ABC transporter permease [Catellatospora sp. KI3]MDI1462002.1 ABC transporter permease [Catellatospora sp. KI3]
MSGDSDGAGAATHRPRRALPPGYVLRKVLAAAVMLLFVTVVNFFLFRVLPGDPAKAFAPRGRNADPEALRELRERLGLGDPWYTAFGKYLRALAQGDLGVSFSQHAKVLDVIGERILPTVLLSGTALVLAAGLGVWLGARGGWRQGSRFDKISSSLAVTFYSVPEWLLGLVLLVLLNKYGVFPARGMNDPRSTLPVVVDTLWHMVLPVTVLTIVYVAEYSLIMRSSMLDERRADYLTTARAKGLRDDLVMRRHALPNALLPSMTLFFMSMGFVVAGAITVETVFSWPGLGLLTYDALRGPDIPLLQGLFLFFSAGVILMNLVADLLMPVLDPRVRTA